MEMAARLGEAPHLTSRIRSGPSLPAVPNRAEPSRRALRPWLCLLAASFPCPLPTFQRSRQGAGQTGVAEPLLCSQGAAGRAVCCKQRAALLASGRAPKGSSTESQTITMLCKLQHHWDPSRQPLLW